jgi:SET domain-containing protein
MPRALHTFRARMARSPQSEARAPIETRNSPIHGRGVYALAPIPRGMRVVEYTGKRITKAESMKREAARLARAARGQDSCVYIFNLNQRHDLDGRSSKNIARLINHSCEPNCRSETIRGRIWIIAKRDIAAGDELSFDYGFPFPEWRQHPCRCGAKSCLGFIVRKDQRWRVRRLLRKKKTRELLLKTSA